MIKLPKIKLNFAIKTPSELDKLSYEELLKYIKELQKNIVQEKPKKNSSNSSISPSSEINKPKRNQSLREKSDKSSGGQEGHKGNYLKQTDNPDEIIFMSLFGLLKGFVTFKDIHTWMEYQKNNEIFKKLL